MIKSPEFYGKRASEVLRANLPEFLERFERLREMGIASEIWLFGSILSGRDDKRSDIDLMLDVAKASPRNYGIAGRELAEWIGFPVHLLLDDGKCYIPDHIFKHRIRLCEWEASPLRPTSFKPSP